MPTQTKDSFIETIDAAAEALLARARGNATVTTSGDGEAAGARVEPAPLSEQIKAFEAVLKWAEIRAKFAPAAPAKKAGKFNGIKDRFDGAAPGRGGARGADADAQDA